jgi:hypothetical protein
MKPQLLLFLMLIVSGAAIAQTDKGKFFIGGGVSGTSVYTGKLMQFSFSLQPVFGAFVVKNFAIGGQYTFAVSSRNDRKGTNYATSIGPIFKYYVGKKAVKGFIQAAGGYAVSTAIRNGNVTSINGFYAGGQIGVSYFFNEHIGMETYYGLSTSGFKKYLPSVRSGVGIGFFLLLNKKKQEAPL